MEGVLTRTDTLESHSTHRLWYGVSQVINEPLEEEGEGNTVNIGGEIGIQFFFDEVFPKGLLPYANTEHHELRILKQLSDLFIELFLPCLVCPKAVVDAYPFAILRLSMPHGGLVEREILPAEEANLDVVCPLAVLAPFFLVDGHTA